MHHLESNMRTASWAIVNIQTGKAEAETVCPNKANMINEKSETYQAIPIGRYLADLNKKIKAGKT